MNQSSQPFLLVRGASVPDVPIINESLPNIEIHDLLTSTALYEKIIESAVVVCRSGYSSLMDLACMQKAAIFVPTPGQTEQEYLAAELMRQGEVYSQSQDDFNLVQALREYKNFKNFLNFDRKNETLKEIIHELLKF